MKIQIQYIIIFSLGVFLFNSCIKDNYDAPGSLFCGSLTYRGDTIRVQQGQVYFQLFEPGWQKDMKSNPINVNVAQTGVFGAMLFDGKYKMVLPAGQGPYLSQDTVALDINGSKTMNIEVTPYYMIRNASIKSSGNIVTGICRIDKIVTNANAKNIERVTLYVSKTAYADPGANIAVQNGSIADLSNISISCTVPTFTTTADQKYVFASIGLKISGVEDMIFSAVQKVNL